MIEYVHTNLVARDWRRLARFYEDVLGCVRVPPERDLGGEWLERGTGVPGARLRGAHLRLPGSTATLELFEYDGGVDRAWTTPHERGYGHLAFAVDDVAAMVERVLAAGGSAVGEVVAREVPGAGIVCFAYVRDPEGNIVELQRWTVPEVPVAEGYAGWAAGYDDDENPTRDADAAVVRAWLPPLDGLAVLELGSGTGKNTVALLGAARIVGLDLSPEMLARARARVPSAELVEHDLRLAPWPVEAGAFDLAIANLVLEHIEDIGPVLAQLATALRPGARALLVELHPYRQLAGKQARFVDVSGATVRVAAHPHSVSELTAAAQAAGFAIERLGEHGDRGADARPGEVPRLLSLELRCREARPQS